MDTDKRLDLVLRNTHEVISREEIIKLLKEKKKPSVYIGTAPTGRPHIGYFMWGLKVADLLNAGFKVKILLADLHAAMDNVPWDVLDKRYKYYEKVIPLMIKSIGADPKDLEFVKGSSYQLKKEYIQDLMKLSSFISVHDAHKAASDVVKLGDNPKLSGLIYPLMQALDEHYLDVDMQIGGTDQRKIMVLARENLPKLGYKSRVELMFPLMPGLTQGGKMSSSVEESKIDLIDDEDVIKTKLNKAYCIEGNPDNGLLPFLKNVLMVIKADKKQTFLVERPAKFGGNVEYSDYYSIEKDFLAKKLHPMDLKLSLAKEINKLLEPIRKNKTELLKLSKEAYNS